jgi:hypothetical protein
MFPSQTHVHRLTQSSFTNLDRVSGRITLILPNDATISAINVKLEAESRTRLTGPRDYRNERSEKKRIELEVHKLLYLVQTVFPSAELAGESVNAQYTLAAGQYVYPFNFPKFPFNNNCENNSTGLLKDLKDQFATGIEQHVKKTLPPTLTGFPGEAEIKYYVKATVVKPKFYQENLRTQVDIKFLPIEPPRPKDQHEETYARRKQQFQKYPSGPNKKSLFKKSSSSEKESEPPAFQVDARLPNPAILTCNEPIPLRVLVQRLNDSDASVYLSMFQIELFGYTSVRAHDLKRVEGGSWVITSLANMNMPLAPSSEKSQSEWKLPTRLWDNIPLPNTVAPSFDTCNISRRYELEVRVGLSHGSSTGMRPELIVLPLRLPVQVWSGIAPPPELLRQMSINTRTNGSAIFDRPAPAKASYDPPSGPPPFTPTSSESSHEPRVGTANSDVPDDAPPSYDDVMAEDIGPVDGPRREYNVPQSEGIESPAFNPDSKSGIGRRVSERLFSSNTGAPRTPTNRSRPTSVAVPTSPVVEESSPRTPTTAGGSEYRDEEGARPPLPIRTATGTSISASDGAGVSEKEKEKR